MTRTLVFILFFQVHLFFIGAQNDLEIKFHLVYNKTPVKNNAVIISKEGDSLTIEMLKCYISAVELKFKNEKIFKEKNSFHLLDFENVNLVNFQLKSVLAGEIEFISFNLGIDSSTSVSGVLPGDLDPSKGMYWAWQSGYINFKLQGTSTKCATRKNQYQFHLGGYLPPYYALRKIKLPVQKENTAEISITIELADFFKEINLNKTNTVMVPGKEAMKLSDLAAKIFYTGE